MNINDVALNALSSAGLTGAKYTSTAYSSSTAAGDLSGAAVVVCNNSGATPGTLTCRTAAQMIADSGLQVGQKYLLILVNGQATGTLTLGADAGPTITITGTATVVANTARIFVVTVTSATTITIQNVCGGITAP